ncbi:MAG: DUF3482 domain-containing protein [Betaproteobacteria bacterium]
MSQVALSLISHTNAGKTTLARTLLGSDIGEVRDAPHVTTKATSYPLQVTPEGDTLLLWDTPGFGDSARLARRLAQQGNPIGWFLSQVWDRYRDEPLYLSQKAVRNVQDETDIVLYLVNASETAADAGYIASELDVLTWIGRPVFVLLNQMGPPQPRPDEEAVERRWREALRSHAIIRGVLPLDAFARCWVQEIVLLRALASAIAPTKREGYDRLVAAWQARRGAQFEESMLVLAAPIASAACDRESLDNPGFKDKVRDALRSIVARPKVEEDRSHAARLLVDRLHAGVRASTARLIAIHGLEGDAVDIVLERVSGDLRIDAPLHEGKAALMGSVVSGAMSGLAADLAAHGLTLGAGTLIGAIAGALGGAGIARGYNVIRGRTGAVLRWDDELLDRLVTAAVLRYLAVAHFGRGRGDWKESECPSFWNEVAQREVDALRPSLSALWSRRDNGNDALTVERALAPLLERAVRSVLDALYPGAVGNARSGADGATTTGGFE